MSEEPRTTAQPSTAPEKHTLLVVGSGEVATALEPIAEVLGWRPIIVDDLAGTEERLEDADSVIVLSHHDGVDAPALKAALAAGRATYIGAMGSRRTQARRREWMLENGVPEETTDSVHGPAGLDIGANTPAEIAVSIVAEVLAVRHGRTADVSALSDRSGPIPPELEPGTAECPAG